ALASTGALTYKGCIANGGAGGCVAPAHNSLGAANSVAVSADGKSVYVTSAGSNSITRFKRETTTGASQYKGCIANGGPHGGQERGLQVVLRRLCMLGDAL